MDITFRLNRLILGESVLVPRQIVRKTERLEVVKPRKVQLREEREIREHGVRRNRNIVEPSPNAPKLIRLVRHPYTQEVTRPKAGEPWRQPRADRDVSERFGEAVRAAFAEGARPRWPKATRAESGLPRRLRMSDIMESNASEER